MKTFRMSVLVGLLVACGGDDPAGDDDAPAADAAPPDAPVGGRPEGVALCYTELSSGHAATLAFWAALREGRAEDRAGVTADLKAAAEAYPQEEEFALLHGLASLWRLAEPLPEEVNDLAGTIAAATTARSELERAYALCPTDHRIPAWLGPIMVRTGQATSDMALVEQGFAVLQQGLDHYPSFVLFSKLLVYADRPKTDPDFQQALDAVTENIGACTAGDPACGNHLHAAHNIEGSMVFLGDVYAKAGDKTTALGFYQMAKTAAEWSEWDYQALMADRIATIDARIAAYDTPATDDDPIAAWTDTNQCSICHRQ
jgi:hypothetical protein